MVSFGITVSIDESTGDVLSAYFQTRKGRVHETREFVDGAAFADYSKDGELLGIELLAQCRVTIIDQLAANEDVEFRRHAKKFMREAGPRQMVAA